MDTSLRDTRLRIECDHSGPAAETTLFVVRPRYRSSLAWLALAGWAGAATPLAIALLVGLGVGSVAVRIALLVVAGAGLALAAFVPPTRRVERRPYAFGGLTPAERSHLRRCVSLVSHLGSLAASALPGPVATHLHQLHQAALDELAASLDACGGGSRSSLPALAGRLQEARVAAERLLELQRRDVRDRDGRNRDGQDRDGVVHPLLDPPLPTVLLADALSALRPEAGTGGAAGCW